MEKTTEQKHNSAEQIREKVLKTVRSGAVLMRPRWHFVLKAVLAILGITLVFAALVYIASFTIFSLHRTGAWFAPRFGPHGWFSLLRSFPIMLVVLFLLFWGILEILVRRYSFTHRRPLIVSALAILMLAILGGVIGAPWHRGIDMRRGPGRPPSPIERIYRSGMRNPPDVRRGIVREVLGNQIVLEDYSGTTTTVLFSPVNNSSPEIPEVGEEIVIMGEFQKSVLRAVGFRTLREEW